MAITVNNATLARQVNGEIEYIYPKTSAELVEYNSTQNLKQKIESIENNGINAENKIDKPLDSNNAPYNGESGQVLETNGDGTTSWANYTKIYVGDGDMPDGYDIQIDPDATAIDIDTTLSVAGAVAEAKAVGDALAAINNTIAQHHAEAQAEAIAVDNLAEEVTNGVKDYMYLRDIITGYVYTIRMENGDLIWYARCENIEITTLPTRTDYVVGEIFDPTGMVISAVGEDGKRRPVTGYTYSTDPLQEGITSITITYVENNVPYMVDVPITASNDYTGIVVTKQPTKTSYYIGEIFDPTGMVVTASYEDGTTRTVTEYTYSTTPLTDITTSITITYVEDGLTFTTAVPITVITRCTGIVVTSKPTKTSYYIGDKFNTTGMVVTASYNDGTSKAVTGYTYPTTALTTNMTSITISYTESGSTFTASVAITVVAAFDTNILKDFTYVANSNGTYTLTGWKGTKNGVASTEVVIPDNSAIIVDPSLGS